MLTGARPSPRAHTSRPTAAGAPVRDPDPAVPHGVPLAGLSTRQLLRLYADILTELVARKIVRSRNAPAGDLGEYLVQRAYGGELAPPSEKSWDVRTEQGLVLQVKTRLIAATDRKSHNYSPFRSWDFDACVFLIFDAHSYDVVRAVEVPVDAVRALVRATTHVNGFRIGTRTTLLDLPGAVDCTDQVARALRALEGDRP